MHRRILISAIMSLLSVASAFGQNGITIGEIDLTHLKWGNQTFDVEARNTGEYLRFLVVETDVVIDGAYLTTHRRARSSYFVLPGESRSLKPVIIIPPTYGQAQVYVRVYDVIDTLDAILPTQTILEQPFSIRFPVPEAMNPYLQERLDLPPRAENHPYFDTEFSRVLMVMLDEGKDISEIATLANCDPTFVSSQADMMVSEGYVTRNDTTNHYALTFPVIRLKEAEASRPLALATADSLANLIERNLPAYRSVVDSMIKSGAMVSDSSDFLNPGGVLLHLYPTVAGLSLWYDLGQRFITRSAPLHIYEGTDPCNAHFPNYMYMIEGGAVFKGNSFYLMQNNRRSLTVMFGDTLPTIACDENFLRLRQANQLVNWSHSQEFLPEMFTIDTMVVRTALNALAIGADSLLAYTDRTLSSIASKYRHEELSVGHRYWFWNLAASRAINKLRERGIIERRGNGQYRFDAIEVNQK